MIENKLECASRTRNWKRLLHSFHKILFWRFTVLILNNKAEKRVVNDKDRRCEYPMKSESYLCLENTETYRFP